MVLPRGVTWVTVAAIRSKGIRKAAVVSSLMVVERRIRAQVALAPRPAQLVGFSVGAWAGGITLPNPVILRATVRSVRRPGTIRRGNPALSLLVQRPSGSNRPARRAVLAKATVRRKKPA